jgi:transposase-like protein
MDWGRFCRETMHVYLESITVKIGGPGKVVEIDESKFGKCKHPVKGQWVFGGIKRGSGRAFLVPVENRTAATLKTELCKWVESETTVISDCWSAYRDIDSLGYEHRTVNHTLHFVDPDTGAHTNTIESLWRTVKLFLGQDNRATITICTSHTTCLWRGAGRWECHRYYISSR